MDKKLRDTTDLGVEIMNSKGRTIRKVIVVVGNFRAAEICFRYQIPRMFFFRPCVNIF